MQYIGNIPMSVHVDIRAKMDVLCGPETKNVGYGDNYRVVPIGVARKLLATYGPPEARLPSPGCQIDLHCPESGFRTVRLVNWGCQYEIHAH